MGEGPAASWPFLFSMTDKVLIPIPDDFDDPDAEIDLVAYFQELIGSDLEPALDTDVWELDQRAQFIEAEVTGVTAEADGIVVSYDVTFDAYYGCRDQNYAGTVDRHIVGTRGGDSWVFDKYIPRLPRDTGDEF